MYGDMTQDELIKDLRSFVRCNEERIIALERRVGWLTSKLKEVTEQLEEGR